MTKASDGSHAPARSRKPSTLAGSVMPERQRPSPNRSPTRRGVRGSSASPSEQVAQDEDGRKARGHEGERRRERARRQARETADAVAAGAAVGEARAETDEQTADDQRRGAGPDRRRRRLKQEVAPRGARGSRPRIACARHGQSPARGGTRPPRRPDAPRTRPFTRMSQAAARPMRTPPARADTGVKWVQSIVMARPMKTASQSSLQLARSEAATEEKAVRTFFVPQIEIELLRCDNVYLISQQQFGGVRDKAGRGSGEFTTTKQRT